MPEAYFTIPTKIGEERLAFEDLKKRFEGNIVHINYCSGGCSSIILRVRYEENKLDETRRAIIEITKLSPLSHVIKNNQE